MFQKRVIRVLSECEQNVIRAIRESVSPIKKPFRIREIVIFRLNFRPHKKKRLFKFKIIFLFGMDKDNQGHVFDNVLCYADGVGRAGFQKTGLTTYGMSRVAKLNISIVG